MSTQHDTERLADLVLGALSPSDREEVEAHLDACPECARHHAELEEALGGLALALPKASPAGALRARLSASLDHLERLSPFAPRLAALLALPVDDARRALHVYERPDVMKPAALHGMRAEPAPVGPGLTGVTALLACFEPGTVLPHHVHAEEEHVLVLQGAYEAIPGPTVRAGEEQVSPAGSGHAIRILGDEPCLAVLIKTVRGSPA